jgi:hypothetical protein
VIDLIRKIGSISFDVAVKDIEEVEVEGTKIPLCGLSTLIATKQGIKGQKTKRIYSFSLGKRSILKNNLEKFNKFEDIEACLRLPVRVRTQTGAAHRQASHSLAQELTRKVYGLWRHWSLT